MTIKGSDIIDRCLAHLGITAADFSKKIGLERPQAIYDLQKGKTKNISNTMADKIVSAFPEFNRVWLMTGEGEMLAASSPEMVAESFTVPLLPTSAMGGSLTGFPGDSVMPYHCERIVSPINDVDFAVTVTGDSMSPEFPSGSRVLVKRVNPAAFIEWGKTYVLDTCNGIIIKEVHKCIDKQHCITCHSVNPDPKYADFDVSMDDIYGIYRVLMCMAVK